MKLMPLVLCLFIAGVPSLAYSQERTLNLRLIGSVDVRGGGPNPGKGVSAYQGLAFTVAGDGSVAIVDISTPTSPVIIGHTPPDVTNESHRALRIGQRDG